MVPEVLTRQSRDYVSKFPEPTLNHVFGSQPIKIQDFDKFLHWWLIGTMICHTYSVKNVKKKCYHFFILFK